MKVGFTGSRMGMSDYQKEELTKYLNRFYAESQLSDPGAMFLHGDAIGADAEAAAIASELNYFIEAFPSNQRIYRAFAAADIVHTPVEPLRRNRLIVQQCEVLIACPSTSTEIMRSGTWMTIRYARNRNCRLILIKPEGKS